MGKISHPDFPDGIEVKEDCDSLLVTTVGYGRESYSLHSTSGEGASSLKLAKGAGEEDVAIMTWKI